MKYPEPKPAIIFSWWAESCGDDICARDLSLPVNPIKRAFWFVRGQVGMFIFGWWWWTK